MNKNPLIKIAVIVLLIGVMSGTYTFMNLGAEDVASCGPAAGCEHPANTAPLVCQSSADCETRGKDEWETCQHKQEPLTDTQRTMSSRDQTTKTQEGFSCLCIESQCKYHKP
jgi:uncharacterized membrane protein